MGEGQRGVLWLCLVEVLRAEQTLEWQQNHTTLLGVKLGALNEVAVFAKVGGNSI